MSLTIPGAVPALAGEKRLGMASILHYGTLFNTLAVLCT